MKRFWVLPLIVLLTLSLCACGALASLGKKAPQASAAGIIGSADGPTTILVGPGSSSGETVLSTASAAASPAAAASAGDMDVQAFSDAFRLLPENPLEENLRVALYLEARDSSAPDATAPATAYVLSGYLDKLKAQIAADGIHYVESVSAMGFDMETEHWAKGDKFKKDEKALGDVTVYDGAQGVKYNTESKTGKKLEALEVTTALRTEGAGLLESLLTAPYEARPDETVNGRECAVFYLDIETMGMKGNTLYIDKATGLVMKNVYGDPKDPAKSMVTEVKSVDTAPVPDEVFTVPTDVTIQ